MNISVIGTGYVGLVSGVCLAEKGHNVVCVDIDSDKVDKINSGIPPIHEKHLDQLLKKQIDRKFTATTNLEKAIFDTDLSIIAVGTPFDGDEIDLSFIKKVSEQIGQVLSKKDSYHVVVVKSTVVPGTTDDVVLPLLEKYSGKTAGSDFGVGMNPEFLREGEAIEDFMSPDRIVLGGIDDRTLDTMQNMYDVFPDVDKLTCNNRTAEMIKYTANSLLATLISFSNEIGNLCSSIDNVDVLDVMKGVHLDKRFSPILENGERIRPGMISYLAAGCGFGGSCFPKDVKALVAHGKKAGQSMQLLDSVIKINEKQPEQVISILQRHFPDLNGKKITVLGLAFKPGTDDMRESASIPIINHLVKQNASVAAYDPVAVDEAKKIFGNGSVHYFEKLDEAVSGADAVILLTGWDEFRTVDELISKQINVPLFIDGRRMLSKKKFKKYDGIGLSV